MSAATRAKGMAAAIARSIIATASFGLVANLTVSGTYAAARRAGSSVQALGRYSARSTKAWPRRAALARVDHPLEAFASVHFATIVSRSTAGVSVDEALDLAARSFAHHASGARPRPRAQAWDRRLFRLRSRGRPRSSGERCQVSARRVQDPARRTSRRRQVGLGDGVRQEGGPSRGNARRRALPGEAALVAARKTRRLGSLVRSSVVVSESPQLAYKGPEAVDDLFETEGFVHRCGVRGGNNRLMRTKPKFDRWTLDVGRQTFILAVDDRRWHVD